MLPTFVIGLREGLEAALIVSIIATFLRRNRASMKGMWFGVAAGVLLSVAVGVVLRVIEQSLPQAEQEMLETVVGGVAVCFVTMMILWMNRHAVTLRAELEESVSQALANGTTIALAVMAFLAVLREGFETSVFLLATISAASSAPAAMLGAVLGLAVAVGLGWAIYRGGLRLDLRRFFTITSVFLVLVAAGLVSQALRTAHEAGWVTIGQGRVVDLGWLAPNGSVRAALLTGVLGISNDPRLIEVICWAVFLVPMMVVVLWPRLLRLPTRLAQRVRLVGAVLGASAAVAVFAVVQVPAGEPEQAALPDTLSVADLVALAGRIPVGIDPKTAPGPYTAIWEDGRIVGEKVLTIEGGGLASPRTITVEVPASQPVVSPEQQVLRGDRQTWRYLVPALLALASVLLGVFFYRGRRGHEEWLLPLQRHPAKAQGSRAGPDGARLRDLTLKP